MSERNGQRPRARARRSRDRAGDPAALDAVRTAGESDQNLSDADQSLSESDQGLAEQDQARSDADQMASDRDQAASDHELESHAPSDELKMAHAASAAERTRSSTEREAGTGIRAGSMSERVANATKRDELASVRDAQAALLDRTAELRDKASDDHERALGRPGAYTAKARATAAADRARAAENRARAAEDRRRAAEDREHALADLEKAQLDDLTDFYRPGLGRAVLQREIDRAQRTGGRLVFAYCDVDGLKRVNDTRGHAAGDQLLKTMAEAMRSRLRSYDPVVRLGGDEFLCAFPGVDLDEAARILRDIQQTLTALRPDASMSFGLGAIEPGDSVATLIERSDEALREVKAARAE